MFPTPFRDPLNRLFPFVGCSQGFRLKDLWSKTFLPFTECFLDGHVLYSEIYDGWLRTAGN